MSLAFFAVGCGLLLLVWSASRFIEGSAATATHLGLPPLLIGMVVIGFGTSAPELVVSIHAASQGNPGIALGNAYGSNIANIGLILGATALLAPIIVRSKILRNELPALTAITGLATWQLWDGVISRTDAAVLLAVFAALAMWAVWQGRRGDDDTFGTEVQHHMETGLMPLRAAILWLIVGMALLILSSRVLVWGAVEIAQSLGVSDLIIGLTVIAIGTSLPELASSLIAVSKGEHDLAVGNVVGSNLVNTLAVVGCAAAIEPIVVEPELLSRDLPVMAALTVSLFIICYAFGRPGRPGRINRVEGALLLASFLGYTAYLVHAAIF
jgi:cation:H+ antiporter